MAATVKGKLAADTPAPPLPTPASLPAEVPAQELPAASPEPAPSPEEAVLSAFEPSTSPPEAAAPAPEPAKAPGPTPSPVIVSGNAAFVSRVVELINAARREEGLAPLSPAPSLMEAAQRQACAMAEAGRLSHTAPDGSTMTARVRAAGYGGWTTLGEVVAAGYASPEEAVAGWLADPDHRARLLDPAYREIGAGYYYLSSSSFGDWWAADLGAR